MTKPTTTTGPAGKAETPPPAAPPAPTTTGTTPTNGQPAWHKGYRVPETFAAPIEGAERRKASKGAIWATEWANKAYLAGNALPPTVFASEDNPSLGSAHCGGRLRDDTKDKGIGSMPTCEYRETYLTATGELVRGKRLDLAGFSTLVGSQQATSRWVRAGYCDVCTRSWVADHPGTPRTGGGKGGGRVGRVELTRDALTAQVVANAWTFGHRADLVERLATTLAECDAEANRDAAKVTAAAALAQVQEAMARYGLSQADIDAAVADLARAQAAAAAEVESQRAAEGAEGAPGEGASDAAEGAA